MSNSNCTYPGVRSCVKEVVKKARKPRIERQLKTRVGISRLIAAVHRILCWPMPFVANKGGTSDHEDQGFSSHRHCHFCFARSVPGSSHSHAYHGTYRYYTAAAFRAHAHQAAGHCRRRASDPHGGCRGRNRNKTTGITYRCIQIEGEGSPRHQHRAAGNGCRD